METVKAVINISPDLYSSLSSFGLTKERLVSDSRKLLALKYFQAKLLSLGKAAELADMSRWDFIEYLSSSNVPVIDYDEEEMVSEFAAKRTVLNQRTAELTEAQGQHEQDHC